MAWNPSFSFKLRDDEITFGTLIFDKNCADMLCEELLRMKQGGHVSIDVIREILDKGCFTDTELDNARAELENIKQDIFEFKQMLTSRQRFEAWYDRTASTGAYIIGSQSWYQHYMALKMTAADMYFKLVSSGEQFDQQAKATYEERYGEILRESSTKERTELALRRQFDENVANGVPNAREIYCEAMMVAGLMSQEQVEAQNKLFSAAGASEVESVIEKTTKIISVRMLIDQLWLEVEAHEDMLHKSLAIERFTKYVKQILADVDVTLNAKIIEDTITDFFVRKNISTGDLYEAALSFKSGIYNGIDCENLSSKAVEYEIAKIDQMLNSIRNVKDKEDQPETIADESEDFITADSLIGLFEGISNIPDEMKKASIIVYVATITIRVLKDAEIGCSTPWVTCIKEFLDGTGTAGSMAELANNLNNVVSYGPNKFVIDACELKYERNLYKELLRKVNEAQFK